MEQLYVGIDLHFLSYPMPQGIKGFLKRSDEQYLIVVNSNISIEAQKKAINHEVIHLEKNDMDSEDDIEAVERRNK